MENAFAGANFPAHLKSLVQANLAPWPSSLPAISKLLTEEHARLASLAPQLAAARAKLASLEAEEAQTLELVRMLEAVSAPMRRLPPELLVRIFEQSVAIEAEGNDAFRINAKRANARIRGAKQDIADDEPLDPAPHPSRAPLLLTRVCASWRDLALSSPRLWIHLRLDLAIPSSSSSPSSSPVPPPYNNVGPIHRPPSPVSGLSTIMHLLSMYTMRASPLPMHLTITTPEPSGPCAGPPPSTASLSPAILAHLDGTLASIAPRLVELRMHLPPAVMAALSSWTNCMLGEMRRVEVRDSCVMPTQEVVPPLMLAAPDVFDDEPDSGPLQGFAEMRRRSDMLARAAPKLREVDLTWSELDAAQCSLPWTSLTRLSLGYSASPFWAPAHGELRAVLRLCKNLEELRVGIGSVKGVADERDTFEFSDDDEDGDNATRSMRITLHHLSTLEVRLYAHTPYLAALLGCLRMPALRSFAIQDVSMSPGPYYVTSSATAAQVDDANAEVSSRFTGADAEPAPLILSSHPESRALAYLARNARTLSFITLDRLDVPEADLVVLLAALPEIRELKLLAGVVRGVGAVIRALAGKTEDAESSISSESCDAAALGAKEDAEVKAETGAGRTLVCPKLESLALRCGPVASDDLVDAVLSRLALSGGGFALKQFWLQLSSINHGPDIREEKLAELQSRLDAAKQQGVRICMGM
ncbi:hypothetical protein CONPUDRAFT_77671 [Coniophora puteana RWD-64-598 SS2]|uniref:Uncharacterized protein n=1 Tax=Coniophora puteana (strain RWD-64-598) TaxID=741705 RepID=A0A5M3M706_CONPW|nr:uncharacterized protein CONPUDRAFT_77671 [Coniophora puteana RWD-64-598 SS2]EIW74853.1 hypothetical protein CONPUDRAFT_77671 [Coniophora puteana RWD-64-598 SS2]